MVVNAKFRELDILDWKVQISFTTENALTRASRNLKINSEVGLYFDGKNTEVDLFFQNRANMERDLNIFLREFEGILENDIWRIKRNKIERLDYIKVIENILDIQTIVMTSIWIDDGVFHAEFIFNRSLTREISGIILDKLVKIEGAKLEYIGPNNGFFGILEEINKRCELSIIQLEILPPKKELKMPENPMGDHWIRILKKPYSTDFIKGVYVVSGEPTKPEALTEVINNKVYEAKSDNKLLSYFISGMHVKRIPTIAAIQRLDIPDFRLWIVFPSLFRNEILKIAADAREDLPEWHPTLKELYSFKEIV